MSIQPFTIAIEDVTLDDLRERLARTRWPDEAENAGWNYGTNLGYLKELVDYWQHSYDWRAQEAKLNQFAQFRADIDGSRIHFIHVRGKGPNPTPLLLIHGWPDSFYRFHKIIPLLTDPAKVRDLRISIVFWDIALSPVCPACNPSIDALSSEAQTIS